MSAKFNVSLAIEPIEFLRSLLQIPLLKLVALSNIFGMIFE